MIGLYSREGKVKTWRVERDLNPDCAGLHTGLPRSSPRKQGSRFTACNAMASAYTKDRLGPRFRGDDRLRAIKPYSRHTYLQRNDFIASGRCLREYHASNTTHLDSSGTVDSADGEGLGNRLRFINGRRRKNSNYIRNELKYPLFNASHSKPANAIATDFLDDI